MQRLNEKQTVSCPSALHTELLSSPGPLAKELQYVGADVKQPVITDKNIIPESTRQVQQQNSGNRTKSNSMVGHSAPHALKVKSMTELYDTVYPPSKPVVEGLLYNGTYLFVGAPKVGKSFFMAQLGYHVSKGIPLWNYPVTQGAVLYLALEDTEERLQKRLARMFGVEDSENFYFAVEAETLNTGLEEQLEQFVERNKDARLIIIDTLQKVKEIGGDKFSYADDYQNVTRLKAFSDKYGVCILLVHHTRKLDSSDSFERISGTNGLLGAADGAFVMEKEKRTDNKATLEVAGRDQQDQKIYLQFDREHCLWKFVKNDVELWKKPPNPLLDAVAALIKNSKVWTGSATELSALLTGIEMEANVLTRALNIAVEDLLEDYKIRYSNKHTSKGSLISLQLMDEMTVSDDMTVISGTDTVLKTASQSSEPSQEGDTNEKCADTV